MSQEKSPQGPWGSGAELPQGRMLTSLQAEFHKKKHTQNFYLILHLASSQFYSQVLVGPFGNVESRVEARKIILEPWKSIFGME